MIIDINMHHLPQNLFSDEDILQGFLSCVPREFGECASMGTVELGQETAHSRETQGFSEPQLRRGRLLARGQARAPWTTPGSIIGILRCRCGKEWLKLDACKAVNDEAADMCKRSNGRIYGTACLPPWGGKENVYEPRAVCIKELRLRRRAARLPTTASCYLDDEAFKPYLKVLERHERAGHRAPHAATGCSGRASSSGPTSAARWAASSTR